MSAKQQGRLDGFFTVKPKEGGGGGSSPASGSSKKRKVRCIGRPFSIFFLCHDSYSKACSADVYASAVFLDVQGDDKKDAGGKGGKKAKTATKKK